MKKTNEKTISDRTWNSGGDQSWYRELIVTNEETRLRYIVRRNAYDEQSKATVDVWADKEWRHVHRIPGVDLMCKSVSYVQRDVRPTAFDADISELRRVAAAILNLNTKESK